MDDNLPNTSGALNSQLGSTSFPPANNVNNGDGQQSSGIVVNPPYGMGLGNNPPNLNQGPVAPPNISAGGVNKEIEKIAKAEALLEESEKNVEIAPEVESAGVQKVAGEVTIPPQLKQMGVKPAGPTAPVSSQVSVSLPITDDQVLKGLHANIFDAFRWLAVWCVRRLRMAHLALKNVHGRVMRVKQG